MVAVSKHFSRLDAQLASDSYDIAMQYQNVKQDVLLTKASGSGFEICVCKLKIETRKLSG